MGILVWGGLTFWVVIFHRKKKNSPEFPRQTAYNVPLELVYTAAPFVAVCVLFYFTVVVQNYVLEKEDNPNVVVDVTGYQWNWKFGYRTIDLGDGTAKYDGTDYEAQELLLSLSALSPRVRSTRRSRRSTGRLSKTSRTCTTTRSRRSVPATKFPFWSSRPVSASSSSSPRPMSSTRSGFPSSCSSGTRTRTRGRTTPIRSSRSPRSSVKVRSSAAAPRCAVPTTR